MRVFRASYKDKKNKLQKYSRKWYLEFQDHLEATRRVPALEDKRQSEALGRMIQKLVNFKVAGETPDSQLTKWLEGIPDRLASYLVRIGLLDPQRAAGGKLLAEHLADFKAFLVSKNNTSGHALKTHNRAKAVFDGCKAISWTDISASRIQQVLADLRKPTVKDGKTIKLAISVKTSNYYLQTVKSFCHWMVQDRRTTQNPLEYLTPINANVEQGRKRRALSEDEIRTLLEKTKAAAMLFGMSGVERAMLYRLAVETGLRQNELRSLTVSSFDLEASTVTLQAAYSKHRRKDVLPLRPDTATVLKGFLSNKMPSVQVFNMPRRGDVIKALKDDLAAAGIPYCDEDGRYADFHAFRHCTGSLLAAAGIHPKVAQSILRHSDVNLTMGIYTHTLTGQESQAVAKLPDLSLPSKKSQEQVKTGTDGRVVDAVSMLQVGAKSTENCLASSLAFCCEKQRILANKPEQKTEKMSESQNALKHAIGASKTHSWLQKPPMPKKGIEPLPPCGDGILNPGQENTNSLSNKVLTVNCKNDSSKNLSFILEEYHDLQAIVTL